MVQRRVTWLVAAVALVIVGVPGFVCPQVGAEAGERGLVALVVVVVVVVVPPAGAGEGDGEGEGLGLGDGVVVVVVVVVVDGAAVGAAVGAAGAPGIKLKVGREK